MATLARDTVIYTPEESDDSVILCQYNDILTSPLEMDGNAQISRYGIIAAEWQRQRSMGNAVLKMAFAVAHAFVSAAAARAWALDVQELIAMHPVGQVRWLTSYHNGRPHRSRGYMASVDVPRVLSMTSDNWFGETGSGAAWQAMEFKLTLTGLEK